jgi:RNA methyltransferase, TrmH family
MSELITSTANPKVKRLRKLTDRRERAREGVYLAEGLRIVIEAVQLKRQIETLVVAPELLVSPAGIETVQAFRALHPEQVMDVSAEVFRSMSGKDGPQGLAAVLRPDWLALEDIHPAGSDCWVALDEVADPGNLGTILRTADSAGARGVILLDNCTDPYDPSALRASMGAVFSLGICKASFEQFADWKGRTGVQLIGTSDRAKEDYHTARYSAPLVILMGSEREGLEQRHFDLCDRVVSIPMNGRSDSLNLAVATAILLYETYQQTRAGRQ